MESLDSFKAEISSAVQCPSLSVRQKKYVSGETSQEDQETSPGLAACGWRWQRLCDPQPGLLGTGTGYDSLPILLIDLLGAGAWGEDTSIR